VDEAQRRRRRLTLLLVPIGCLVVASNVGRGLFATLATEHPLLLLALDARNASVLAVSGSLDAVSYYLVGTLRLLLSDPLFYLLGYWYGEAALAWVDRRGGSIGKFLRDVEGFFTAAAYPLVFLAPNNYICLFAGASRMRPAVFLTLNVSGTVARLALLRYVGDVFDGPRDSVLGFIGDYQLPLTIFGIVVIGGQALWDRRKGTDELTALSELEEEVVEHGQAAGGSDEPGGAPAPPDERP
jgi:membrane protein DedA with SNARE-associated domain